MKHKTAELQTVFFITRVYSAYHKGDITPASSSEAFLFSLSKYVLVSTASMVWLGLIGWLLYSFIGWPLALELAFV